MKKTKSGEPCSVITIAGIYDHPEVPLFAIEGILYHEMLHEAIPPYSRNGRRVIHGPEFNNAERAFPGFVRWREWEKTELHRLVRKFRQKSRWK